MKVGRQFLGKLVEVTWRDPGHDRVKTHMPERADLPSGWEALATWVERGVLDDCKDGVLRILHSEACEPRTTIPDEFVVSWVPETLVTKIVVFAPTSTDTGTVGGGP